MAEERILASRDAEQSVLGSVFFDEKSIKLMIDKLMVEDFYYSRHQFIYQAMLDLYNSKTPIDSTTIISILQDKEKLVDSGGAEYIYELVEAVPTTSNLETYINIVKDKSIQRKVIATCNDIIAQSKGDISDSKLFLDDVETKILNATRERSTRDVVPIGTILTSATKKISENSMLNRGEVTGLDTGYSDLNRLTLGLQNSELIILAARPSVGKTAFALNLATNIALLPSKPYIVFFSLEMGVEQLALRLLSSAANIDQTILKSGQNLPRDFWTTIGTAQESLSNTNLFFDDSGANTIQDVKSICRKKYNDGQLDLVIVDYLQLLSSAKKQDNRVQEVSEISRGLKEIARELNVPVLALSQVSRSIDNRQDKTPNMSDLRESGSIEQDADVVMFIYREDIYKKPGEPKTNIAKIILAKNRNGITSDFELWFEASYTKFVEMPSRQEREEEQ